MKLNNLSETHLIKILEKEKRPIKLKDIERDLRLSQNEKKRFKTLVKDMIKKGLVFKLKNKMIGLRKELNLETGTLWCTKNGNGIVIPEREGKESIYIPQRFIKHAIHGDRVVVRLDRKGIHGREGKILEVLERKTRTVTGFIKRYKNLMYLYPDDERMPHHFIIEAPSKIVSLKDNTLVAAKITKFPEGAQDPICKIVKTFETLSSVKTISLFTVYKYSLPMKFKKTTELYLKGLSFNISIDGRKDLREKPFVTIDGELAKDFDDAVCVEKTKNGFILYVSIADVSHYVPIHSPPDSEAYERGTSVYFPGSVIPMLPKILSNNICSLNPNQDRHTITIELHYDKHGNIIDRAFYPSLIKSAMRLTYTKVEDLLENRTTFLKKDKDKIFRQLEYMAELATILKAKRQKRGTIDFDFPEPEVVLDIEGGLTGIIKSPRLFSHTIIEEFMIAANEAVAEFITENNKPLVYRIHEPPDNEKMLNIEKMLHTLDVGYKRHTSQQHFLQSILKKVKGTAYEYFVNRIILRSMKQAKYSILNKGHFGLASKAYTHFTSPIRRYPDLINHRILKGLISGRNIYTEEELEPMAIYLSERERIAMEAEREVEDRIRVLFMKDKIGEVFEGVISHITSYGFFVELIDVFVEGLVHLSEMVDDYYVFEEEKFRLKGRRTKKTYRIGDKILVRVVRADVERNHLHFTPVLR
ncbi:MAG TPA: ribonuclease R [Syntrophorhabdaceae bacterium]|nr:ribonuclease R [Syntrophorhabdaceae bacterium]HPU30498.1 ribonuclease R [Syntrophorhabdaceae bacterium]